MVTSYSMDYGKKDGTPSEKRPCSATRRNRPHPSKVIGMKLRKTSSFIVTFKETVFDFALLVIVTHENDKLLDFVQEWQKSSYDCTYKIFNFGIFFRLLGSK